MSLFTPPVVRATDANNNALSGAKWYFYVTGGTTPAPTYTTSALNVAHTNPVVADASGSFAPIYLDPAINYRAVLKTSAGIDVPNGDVDPIDSGYSTFAPGRAVAIAGSKARVDWVRDDALSPLENLGGLWSSAVHFNHGLNRVFSAGDGVTGAPVTTLVAAAKNTGSAADVVGSIQVAEAASASASVFGGNTVVFSSGGFNNCKLIGWEIDVEPEAGTTPISAAGLVINAFTMTAPGPAIYFEGIFGGKWSTGINVGNLSDIGAGIAPASGNPRMGSLVDTGTAQYQGSAIRLSNLHRIRFEGVSGNPAYLYVDASNFMHSVIPTAGWTFRNNTDAASLVSIQDNAGQGLINIETSAGELRVNNVKVIGARGAAVSDAVNAAGVPTQAEFNALVTQVNLLLARLRAATGHGLIA